MKKICIFLFSFLAIIAKADEIKMALLQPRVAEGSDPCRPIELNMVRGELRKAFGWQSEFQVLTRTDVDAMLQEHGFQQTGMVDEAQRKQVGVMTGAHYICVSTITKDGTQLYIEAYLVNIETGQMTNPATQFANVVDGDYGKLQAPCNELAKEMLGELGGISKSVPSNNSSSSEAYSDGSVEGALEKNYVQMGELMVAVGELVDMNYTEAVQYAKKSRLGGYADWRLPTTNELLKILQQSVDRHKNDPSFPDLTKQSQAVEKGTTFCRYWCTDKKYYENGTFKKGTLAEPTSKTLFVYPSLRTCLVLLVRNMK